MPRVLVSIVSWNTSAELRRCLAALQHSRAPWLEVVVVDNASPDDSAAMVAAEFPWVRLISAERNLGFAGGNNLALHDCSADYVLILNPDVEVAPDTIARLVAFLESTPRAAAVAPLLTGADDVPQAHLYRRFPSFAQIALFWTLLRPVARAIAPLRRRVFEHDLRGTQPVAVEQLPGAAMLIRGSALRAVGLLDAGYFIWWEDVDWCFRAIRAGFTLYVLPAARCRHAGGASFASWSLETRAFQFYRAFYRFLAKHRLHALARRITPLILADLAWKDALLRLRRRGSGGIGDTRSAVRRIAAQMPQGVVPDFHSAASHDELPVALHVADDSGHIDAVIVNWNGKRWLARCIEALQRSTIPVRVIVVDNASTDGSAAYVKAAHAEVELVEAGLNCGYAAGANLGLARVRARYAFVLNPDVLVEPDHLERLRDRLDEVPEIGAAQGKLYRLTAAEFEAAAPTCRELDSAGHVLRRSRMVTDRGQGEADSARYGCEASVFSACGAALFLRMAMMRDIAVAGEYFAEAFFAYKEDIDLCWRARLRGWDVRYVPAAVAHHVRTLPLDGAAWRALPVTARRHSWKNHYLLMVRNDSALDVLRALPQVLGWELLRLGHALLRDPRVLPAYIMTLRMLPGALRARGHIRAARTVAAADVRRWFGAEPQLVTRPAAEPALTLVAR